MPPSPRRSRSGDLNDDDLHRHVTTLERRRNSGIIAAGTPLLTHNYVIVESLSLLQRRLGLASAARFERESRWFDVEWVTRETHAEAARRWTLGRRTLSFVDHVSFVVMQVRGITTAFVFDPDFRTAGFTLY